MNNNFIEIIQNKYAKIFLLFVLFIFIHAKNFSQTNVALGKNIVASSVYDNDTANYSASYVTDGSLTTKWLSANTWSQWLYVDLGKTHDIDSIIVRWDSGEVNTHAITFTIQISDNAVQWKTIDSIIHNKLRTNTFARVEKSGRFVRINALGRSGTTGYSIKEFEVYGIPNSSSCGDTALGVNLSSIYPPSGWYPPEISENGQTTYPSRISFFKANPLSCGDIVMLGNSITANGGDWATRLCSPIVKNRGIASDIVEGVLARLGEIYYYKPSKIFMLIGINNLATSNYTSSRVADSICNLVKYIHAMSPLTQIYVQTILPTTKTSLVAKIKATNDTLKARESSHPYTLIDIHSLFADSNDLMQAQYTTDGTHLTEAGYRLWVKKLVDNYDITPLSTGNLALQKLVIAKGSSDTAHTGNKAVDGDSTTQWQSGSDTNNVIRIDLGRTYNIKKVIIKWDVAAYGTYFSIQTSDDEANWTTIASVSSNTSHYTELNALLGQGRYIRINATSSIANAGYAIKEFEVYDDTSATLPVGLINFNVQPQKNQQVKISWETATEINEKYFTIEKSINAKEFVFLAQILAVGKNNSTYSFSDNNSYLGTTYYRLSETDKDDRITYLGIRLVNNNNAEEDIAVFPNPTKNRAFTVKLKERTTKTIVLRLVDYTDHVVWKETNTNGSNIIPVSLSNSIISGIYLLKVENKRPLKIILN